MSIHAAITIFTPFETNKRVVSHHYDYFYQLARIRLQSFTRQKGLTKLTILTNAFNTPRSKTIIKMIKEDRKLYNNKMPVELIVVDGNSTRHIGAGLLQTLLETDCEWIYFSEDGHVLPITNFAVQQPLEEAINYYPTANVVVESSMTMINRWSVRHFFPEHCRCLENEPTFTCGEWGHYCKSDLLRQKIYHEASECRQAHGFVWGYQGAKVACSRSHKRSTIHHDIVPMGQGCWRLWSNDPIEPPTMFEPSKTFPSLTESINNQIDEIRRKTVIVERRNIIK